MYVLTLTFQKAFVIFLLFKAVVPRLFHAKVPQIKDVFKNH